MIQTAQKAADPVAIYAITFSGTTGSLDQLRVERVTAGEIFVGVERIALPSDEVSKAYRDQALAAAAQAQAAAVAAAASAAQAGGGGSNGGLSFVSETSTSVTLSLGSSVQFVDHPEAPYPFITLTLP